MLFTFLFFENLLKYFVPSVVTVNKQQADVSH